MFNKSCLSLMIFVVVAQLGLIGFNYFQLAARPPTQFFSQIPNTEATPLLALERPNVSTAALLSWVTLAATATFSFDFVNYKDQLKALRDYFTVDGYDNFMASLQNANILNTIEEKKLVLSAVAIGPAIVLTEEDLRNNHSWRIQVPILVRYQSANVDETRTQIIELLVTQVSTQDAPKGIGIAQYIAQEAGPEVTA